MQDGVLVFNKFRLGPIWFERGVAEDVLRLLIHEFGHEYSADHLNAQYHEALCQIGAGMFLLAQDGNLRLKPVKGVGKFQRMADLVAVHRLLPTNML